MFHGTAQILDHLQDSQDSTAPKKQRYSCFHLRRVLLVQPTVHAHGSIAEESSNSVSESLEMTSYFRLLRLKSAIIERSKTFDSCVLRAF